MKGTEKRETKSYKAKPSTYAKARRRAKKEKLHLANIIESALESYASGGKFIYVYGKSGINVVFSDYASGVAPLLTEAINGKRK
jgi:hypothetical protein